MNLRGPDIDEEELCAVVNRWLDSGSDAELRQSRQGRQFILESLLEGRPMYRMTARMARQASEFKDRLRANVMLQMN
jgi:hypothetical protein